MGMIGYYAAADESVVELIADGEMELEEFEGLDDSELDVDKSWQALHYLFCGDIADGEPPLGYVVPMIDEQMIEYGSFGAFYLHYRQVLEALEAMQDLTREDLFSLYDMPAMVDDEVYPVVEGEDETQLFEYLLEYFFAIRDFYDKAAENGQGILFYVG